MKNVYFSITNTLRRTQNLNLLTCAVAVMRQNTSGWRPWYQERQVFNFPNIIVHELKVDDKKINSLVK